MVDTEKAPGRDSNSTVLYIFNDATNLVKRISK